MILYTQQYMARSIDDAEDSLEAAISKVSKISDDTMKVWVDVDTPENDGIQVRMVKSEKNPEPLKTMQRQAAAYVHVNDVVNNNNIIEIASEHRDAFRNVRLIIESIWGVRIIPIPDFTNLSEEFLIGSVCLEEDNGDRTYSSFSTPKSVSEIKNDLNTSKIIALYLPCKSRWSELEIDGLTLNKIPEEVNLFLPLEFKGTPNPGVVKEEKQAIPHIMEFLEMLYADINSACGMAKECKAK